ncbi:MAG: DNA-directed RNA polymerase subunit alpha C-terminal domain-containing protein [Alphaproteobacteria bacterium]
MLEALAFTCPIAEVEALLPLLPPKATVTATIAVTEEQSEAPVPTLLQGLTPQQVARLNLKAEDQGFSVRLQNALKTDNLVYMGQAVGRTEQEFLRMSNFGRKSLNELKEWLASDVLAPLHLGMDLHGWTPPVDEA